MKIIRHLVAKSVRFIPEVGVASTQACYDASFIAGRDDSSTAGIKTSLSRDS